ncbi:MAG: type II toxin-antitoxin system PemK/MazF family toxin [Alphaproteobacteria bacterium]|nr:type II toxin-antitoxin system PemK/MazF family toxin [Alphaproteobacteria bacterium]MDP6565422.1 type II toxin-antitoxin system PemK/MazF family toxin [Alphaproteobacteria bacterium]MDP6816101.1 type II toxin-antitoxin system PemK/MazF family toxin [Alphaproteobacteria bacterium]
MSLYQPERGDFCFLDFAPTTGMEQAGRRPALVLSPQQYNIATSLAFVCPVTNQAKGSVFEVAVPPGARISGVVLANQLRAVDWLARNADFASKAPRELLDEALAIIEAILNPDQ